VNLESIRKIVEAAAKTVPNATVQMPLGVWDNGAGSMGIEIRQPQDRAGTACELTASIVLTKREQQSAELIRQKVKAAMAAIIMDVQVVIRPVKPPKFDARQQGVT
jgi:hypothetical protein